ncbi:hypothetical protein ACGFZK_29805 [Streptomyces sp. NPDC048257]|uniref:hypothetical protein n=1 Tax=Streptomyces sp. NPDC048257 TaxID=3365526 RepID=UPI00372102B6
MCADEPVYYPVHARLYCPAPRLEGGTKDAALHTKWWVSTDLALRTAEDGFAFRAVTGGCAEGDIDNFRATLREARLPFVPPVRPTHGTWAREKATHTRARAQGHTKRRCGGEFIRTHPRSGVTRSGVPAPA